MSDLRALGGLMVIAGAGLWLLRRPVGRANGRLDRSLGGSGARVRRWTEWSYESAAVGALTVGLVLLAASLL